MKDLVDLGIWNEQLKNEIIAHKGSVQSIDEIPQDLKALYKTVWEIKQKSIIDMAADRGAFIDQSHSLNIHIAEATYANLTSMHFYGWKKVRIYYASAQCFLKFLVAEWLNCNVSNFNVQMVFNRTPFLHQPY